MSFNAGSSLARSGSGHVVFDGAQVTFNVPYTLPDLALSSGSVTLQAPASIPCNCAAVKGPSS